MEGKELRRIGLGHFFLTRASGGDLENLESIQSWQSKVKDVNLYFLRRIQK